jgi:hypothetical protein
MIVMRIALTNKAGRVGFYNSRGTFTTVSALVDAYADNPAAKITGTGDRGAGAAGATGKDCGGVKPGPGCGVDDLNAAAGQTIV